MPSAPSSARFLLGAVHPWGDGRFLLEEIPSAPRATEPTFFVRANKSFLPAFLIVDSNAARKEMCDFDVVGSVSGPRPNQHFGRA